MTMQGIRSLPLIPILRHSGYLALATLVTAIAGFFTNIILARSLEAESLGYYNFFLSVISVISITALPSMGSAVVQAVSIGKEGSFARIIRLCLKSSLIGSLIVVGIGIIFLTRGSFAISILFFISATLFPPYSASGLYISFLSGKKYFKEIAIRNAGLAIASALCLSGAAYMGADAATLGILFLLLGICVNAPGTWKTYRTTQLKPVDPAIIKLGGRLQIGEAFQTAATYADAFIISHILGFTALGNYAIAKIIPETLKSGGKIIAEISFPHLLEKNMDRRAVNDLVFIMVLFWAGMALAYTFFSPFFYGILFPSHLTTLPYSQLISLSLITFPTGILKNALQGSFADRYLNGINTASSVFGIIILLVFTSAYGLLGAIIARLITRFLIFFLHIASWIAIKQDSFKRAQ